MQVLLKQLYRIYVLACIVVLSTSCERLTDIDEPVSFIEIEPFLLEKSEIQEYGLQENIYDAWVFQNGQPLGVYQLPVTLPVFGEGANDFRIFPGILERGISLNRIRHPFLLAYDTNVDLKGEDTLRIQPTTVYDTLTTFSFVEQFESGNSIEGTDVTSASGEVLDGTRSGKWTITDTTGISEIVFPLIQLPNDGRPIIFELNYKNSVPFDVFMKEFREGIEYYIITSSSKTEWNTLYVNLTPEATQAQSQAYQIVLKAGKVEPGQTETILLDNLKIMHR